MDTVTTVCNNSCSLVADPRILFFLLTLLPTHRNQIKHKHKHGKTSTSRAPKGGRAGGGTRRGNSGRGEGGNAHLRRQRRVVSSDFSTPSKTS